MIHDDSLVLDLVGTVEPRFISARPNAAEHERQILIAVAECWSEDENQVETRIGVKEKTADVMQTKYPRRQAILVSLQAVD